MTAAMIAMLKAQEGFRASPYTDTRGFSTIGYGTNLDGGITENQASQLLLDQLEINSNTLHRFGWFNALDGERQDVIENMTYNMGVSGILKFTKMIEALIARDWKAAAAEMIASQWQAQVGKRAFDLADLMENSP